MSCFYDLHIHTALSPCADDEMTPNNIVNMAQICGLDVIAVTDHNSTDNCEAVIKAAKDTPLTVLCGMELCTNEEIHVVCLLPDVESAKYFGNYVKSRTPKIDNRTDIYGRQLILDSEDNVIGEEKTLLLTAADISISNLHHILYHYGGVAVPAHIERESYGILSVLGDIPIDCFFDTAEVRHSTIFNERDDSRRIKEAFKIITNSDAHNLLSINEAENELPCEADFLSISRYLQNHL